MSSWTVTECGTCRGTGEEVRETGKSWPDGWRIVAVRECRECGGDCNVSRCERCGGTSTVEMPWQGPPRTDGRVTVTVCAGCQS